MFVTVEIPGRPPNKPGPGLRMVMVHGKVRWHKDRRAYWKFYYAVNKKRIKAVHDAYMGVPENLKRSNANQRKRRRLARLIQRRA